MFTLIRTLQVGWSAWWSVWLFVTLHSTCLGQRPSFFEFGLDTDAAQKASGIDLAVVASNRWNFAEEARAGSLAIRAALDKQEYKIGEPIHLFLYVWNTTEAPTAFAKNVASWSIRVTVVSDANSVMPKTDLGEWLDRRPSPLGGQIRRIQPGTYLTYHQDVSEIVALRSPGKYRLIPKLILAPREDNSIISSELVAPNLGFAMLNDVFTRGQTKSESSVSAYRRSVESAPAPRVESFTFSDSERHDVTNAIAQLNSSNPGQPITEDAVRSLIASGVTGTLSPSTSNAIAVPQERSRMRFLISVIGVVCVAVICAIVVRARLKSKRSLV